MVGEGVGDVVLPQIFHFVLSEIVVTEGLEYRPPAHTDRD